MGWSRMDGEWWPAVAERIAKPWPEEAAAFDLRFHAEQGRGEVTRGRPFFAARWGWTDWSVKLLLRREEMWRDPFLPRQPAASQPPEVRQKSASGTPAPEQMNADDSLFPASQPPEVRQPAASPPPAERHARVVDPTTLHPTPSNPNTVRAAKRSAITPEVQEVYDHWKQWHPKARGPDKDFIAHVGARLAEGRTVADLKAVATWAHTSESFLPQRLRAGGFLGASTLYKPTKMGDRIESATTREPDPVADWGRMPDGYEGPRPKRTPEEERAAQDAALERLRERGFFREEA